MVHRDISLETEAKQQISICCQTLCDSSVVTEYIKFLEERIDQLESKCEQLNKKCNENT